MGKVIVGATMSLDGFINDRNGDLGPLYPDMDALPGENERLQLTFVTDGIERAIRQAKAAAGDKDVTVVGGASTAQQCMRAGLADRIDIYLAPLLLGGVFGCSSRAARIRSASRRSAQSGFGGRCPG